MGKLYIGSADDLNRFHNAVSLFLQPFLQFFGNGEHGRRTEGVAGMHTHGVDVLDKADRDHPAVRVPHYLQFQLLPAQDRLFHQHLAHQAGLQASGHHRL